MTELFVLFDVDRIARFDVKRPCGLRDRGLKADGRRRVRRRETHLEQIVRQLHSRSVVSIHDWWRWTFGYAISRASIRAPCRFLTERRSSRASTNRSANAAFRKGPSAASRRA